MSRAPTYFAWGHRKRLSNSNSNSPRQSSPHKSMSGRSQDNDEAGGGRGDSAGPSPHKMRSPRGLASAVAGVDTQSTDTRSSGVSGESDSQTQSASISPKHKDPDRIKKDREREDRVRQARERLEEERKKKLVEIQEQQKQAQENREKQLEMRRRKIEDLRRRDVERRAAVEERRRQQEESDRPYMWRSLYSSRRETLLIKAEERVARYEAWKRGGQKGARGHVLGFGSATPRDICLPLERARRSSSHSALVRCSPNGSDSDYYSFRPQRRALSACSTVRRHCCVDVNRPTASTGLLPSWPKSVMTLSASSAGSANSASAGGVRLRESKSPRKPRPASVATSMPSFMSLEPPYNSPRSKSTDRLARERSKTRGSRSAASADRHDEKPEEKKPGVKISRSTLDRLSTPRQLTASPGEGKEATPPKKESPITRVSPRKAFSTSNLAMTRKTLSTSNLSKPQKKSSVKEKKNKEKDGKETPAKPHHPPSSKSTPNSTPAATPTPSVATPSTPKTHTPSRTPTRALSPAPGADEDGGSDAANASPAIGDKDKVTPFTGDKGTSGTGDKATPSTAEKSATDITAEEYKAKLAEKRRQARERAEREAEEERKRQEELELQEEERRRQEEEEQRRQEEESLRLGEEARQAEDERLRKAIKAEEQRKAEEAARLEQERQAKEEAERKAREEAERLDHERHEKARKEEEERQERKKRLEMIMKRVKTDSPADPKESKSLTSSPTKSAASNASSDASPAEPENKDFAGTIAPTAAKTAWGEPEETVDGGVIPAEGSGTLSPAGEPSTPEQEAAPSSAIKEASPEELGLDYSQSTVHTESESKPIAPAASEAVRASTPEHIPPYVQSSTTRPAEAAENGSDRPKFKSPLLQKLVEGKDDAGASSGGPRFKSPLLQNILGKTKVGARMGLGLDHSVSTPNLSSRIGNGQGAEEPGMTDGMSTSMVDVGSAEKEARNTNEEKDVDTSESSSSSHSSPGHRVAKSLDSVANGESEVLGVETSQNDTKMDAEPMDVSSFDPFAAPCNMATSAASFWSEQDSGASFGSDDLRNATQSGSLQLSFNGHGPASDSGRLQVGPGMEDSSISMRSVESSVTSSITDSATGSVFSSISSLPQGQGHSGGDPEFEELIDLSVSNKPASTSSTVTAQEHSDDLVNFNKFEGESEETTGVPLPIIAFEESNTIRRQDVTDLLS